MTPKDHEAIAELTAKALRKDRDDCDERSGHCLIYTADPQKVQLHLDQHTFLAWLMGWVNPARKETKSIVIKIFVYFLLAAIVAGIYLFAPSSIKGLFLSK